MHVKLTSFVTVIILALIRNNVCVHNNKYVITRPIADMSGKKAEAEKVISSSVEVLRTTKRVKPSRIVSLSPSNPVLTVAFTKIKVERRTEPFPYPFASLGPEETNITAQLIKAVSQLNASKLSQNFNYPAVKWIKLNDPSLTGKGGIPFGGLKPTFVLNDDESGEDQLDQVERRLVISNPEVIEDYRRKRRKKKHRAKLSESGDGGEVYRQLRKMFYPEIYRADRAQGSDEKKKSQEKGTIESDSANDLPKKSVVDKSQQKNSEDEDKSSDEEEEDANKKSEERKEDAVKFEKEFEKTILALKKHKKDSSEEQEPNKKSNEEINKNDEKEPDNKSEDLEEDVQDEEKEKSSTDKSETTSTVNYDDKSDDYVISTRRDVWNYDHEDWAVAKKIDWNNTNNSSEIDHAWLKNGEKAEEIKSKPVETEQDKSNHETKDQENHEKRKIFYKNVALEIHKMQEEKKNSKETPKIEMKDMKNRKQQDMGVVVKVETILQDSGLRSKINKELKRPRSDRYHHESDSDSDYYPSKKPMFKYETTKKPMFKHETTKKPMFNYETTKKPMFKHETTKKPMFKTTHRWGRPHPTPSDSDDSSSSETRKTDYSAPPSIHWFSNVSVIWGTSKWGKWSSPRPTQSTTKKGVGSPPKVGSAPLLGSPPKNIDREYHISDSTRHGSLIMRDVKNIKENIKDTQDSQEDWLHKEKKRTFDNRMEILPTFKERQNDRKLSNSENMHKKDDKHENNFGKKNNDREREPSRSDISNFSGDERDKPRSHNNEKYDDYPSANNNKKKPELRHSKSKNYGQGKSLDWGSNEEYDGNKNDHFVKPKEKDISKNIDNFDEDKPIRGSVKQETHQEKKYSMREPKDYDSKNEKNHADKYEKNHADKYEKNDADKYEKNNADKYENNHEDKYKKKERERPEPIQETPYKRPQGKTTKSSGKKEELWNRHAHNDWDNVGVDSSVKKDTSRNRDWGKKTIRPIDNKWNKHGNNDWGSIRNDRDSHQNYKVRDSYKSESKIQRSQGKSVFGYVHTSLPFKGRETIFDDK